MDQSRAWPLGFWGPQLGSRAQQRPAMISRSVPRRRPAILKRRQGDAVQGVNGSDCHRKGKK
eukprot:scaffold162975_cov20-Tisochrysis_lutea.AAC.1